MKRKEHKYHHSHQIINLSCSYSTKYPYRCLYSSFSDTNTSHIHLIDYSTETSSFIHLTQNNPSDNPYPPTSLKCIPKSMCYGDNFITSGEKLRLYNITESNTLFQLSTIDDSFSNYPSCGFDWCCVNCDLICCWYLNNTCSVWNVETSEIIISFGDQSKKQINDMKYSPTSPDLFVVSTQEGTLQLTDIRINANSTTINVQGGLKTPLTKISWNSVDSEKIATFNEIGNELFLIDIRNSQKPFKSINTTKGMIMAIDWSKSNGNMISVGMTNRVCVMNVNTNETVWEMEMEDEISDLCWSKVKDDLICVSIGNDIVYYSH